jgi:hypothetical protein
MKLKLSIQHSVFGIQFSRVKGGRGGLRSLLLLLLVATAAGLAGCATTESDNLSERPWNTPKSWETGLPSALTEGR